jgi:hypothetical protein
MTFSAKRQNYLGAGITFRESGTGKMVGYIVNWEATAGATLNVIKITNATTFSSYANTSATYYDGSLIWLKITYTRGSPGTISFSYSRNGSEFSDNQFSENANTFFTTAPDQWGLLANANSSGGSSVMRMTAYGFNQA